MNPYTVLGVEEHADDKTIRKAYLELVKIYPPDREKQRFQIINKAFELIKNENLRYHYRLFNLQVEEESPLAILTSRLIMPHNRKPMNQKKMKEFMLQCLNL